MSSVRKCDRCGRIFGELEDGWQTFLARTMKRDENGRLQARDVSMDACPSCSMSDVSAPPVSIRTVDAPARVTDGDHHRALQPAHDPDALVTEGAVDGDPED